MLHHRDVLARALRARRMSRLSAGAALAAAALAASTAAAGGRVPGAEMGVTPAVAERVLRDHALKTLDGHTLTLGSLTGQVVVVNFWASWCPPCRRELPRLGRMQSASPGVRVVAVSIDEDESNARRFCTAQNVKLQVVHDGPDGLARALDLKHVPLTIVLDRAGRVAYTTTGSDEKALANVESTARRLTAETPSAVAGESR